MSSDNYRSSSSGLGIVGVLTIIFVVLKLVGTIAWSWWWVFSPIFISFALTLVVIFLIAAIAVIFGNR